MIRIRLDLISALLAALTVTLAIAAKGPRAAGPVTTALKADRLDALAPGPTSPTDSDLRYSVASQSTRIVQLASLDPGAASGSAVDDDPTTASTGRATFDERFDFALASLDDRLASFNERFAVTGVVPEPEEETDSAPGETAVPDSEPRETASLPDPAPREAAAVPAPAQHEAALPVVRRPAPPARKLAMLTPEVPANKTRLRVERDLNESSAPEIDGRTAIYDIAAHAVFLPNGKRLEAHSGLGSHMDDPHAITLKGRGPTPPNVYRLALRERIFHGVRAIRLIPADDRKMFGRDGMLAHSYMLGPNGQSNGCVSFNDYPAFLNAYLRGDIDRLVVVEHLAHAPAQQGGSRWLADAIGGMLRPFEGAATGGGAGDRNGAMSYQ